MDTALVGGLYLWTTIDGAYKSHALASPRIHHSTEVKRQLRESSGSDMYQGDRGNAKVDASIMRLVSHHRV